MCAWLALLEVKCCSKILVVSKEVSMNTTKGDQSENEGKKNGPDFDE